MYMIQPSSMNNLPPFLHDLTITATFKNILKPTCKHGTICNVDKMKVMAKERVMCDIRTSGHCSQLTISDAECFKEIFSQTVQTVSLKTSQSHAISA